MRHLLPKDLVGFLAHAEAVHLVEVSMGLEAHHHVEPLVRADRGEAIEVGHIDDANAADFHVATREVQRAGHEVAAHVLKTGRGELDDNGDFEVGTNPEPGKGWRKISSVPPKRVTVDTGREAQQNRADVECRKPC